MTFKTTMEFEVYIDLLPKKLRFALASLRLSSHKLRIETDRYSRNRIDRVQRKCLNGNLNDLEDEYHLVLRYVLCTTIYEQLILKNTTLDVRVYTSLLNCLSLQINLL